MYLKPSEPHTIGGVLDDSIRLYRASFKNVWLLAFLMEIPLAAQRVYLDSLMANVNQSNPRAALEVFLTPNLWLYYLLVMILIIIAHIALLASIDSVARSAPIGLGPSLSAGMRLFPRTLASVVVFMFAFVMGSLLLVVPGIFLLGSWCLAVPSIVVDDQGVFGSLGTSSRLTWGHWWRTVTIYSVIGLLVIIVAGVVGGIVSAVFVGIFGLRSLPAIAAAQCAAFVIGVLLMSLIPCALLSIYYDLKLRKEGTDLAQRVQALPTR